jgi:hypothetical protein
MLVISLVICGISSFVSHGFHGGTGSAFFAPGAKTEKIDPVTGYGKIERRAL